MATTKKSTTKKAAVRPVKASRAAVKPKKAPVKKRTAKKVSVENEMRSFRLAREDAPFTSFRVTRQTFYWIILVAFIIFAQLWIISLQVEVASLLDAQQAQLQDI